MYNLNNLDFVILGIVIVSALIALNRGLIKEVLSIVGWVLSTVILIYALPVCVPFAKKYDFLQTASAVWFFFVDTAPFFLHRSTISNTAITRPYCRRQFAISAAVLGWIRSDIPTMLWAISLPSTRMTSLPAVTNTMR